MPSAMAAAARIFEDADACAKPSKAIKAHKRTPSVGEFLRGRKNKENDPEKVVAHNPATKVSETPLGERHINSPPQGRRLPVKDDAERPTMHKKTKSSISLKSLVKDKSLDSGSTSSSEGRIENLAQEKVQEESQHRSQQSRRECFSTVICQSGHRKITDMGTIRDPTTGGTRRGIAISNRTMEDCSDGSWTL